MKTISVALYVGTMTKVHIMFIHTLKFWLDNPVDWLWKKCGFKIVTSSPLERIASVSALSFVKPAFSMNYCVLFGRSEAEVVGDVKYMRLEVGIRETVDSTDSVCWVWSLVKWKRYCG